MNSISASRLSELIASGKNIELIDVRTPAEFREVHVTVARNEPLNRLDPQAILASRKGSGEEPLYVICRSGARGKQACETLSAAGVRHVVNIEGGTMACAAIGIPVVRGPKTIPLNCQVQIITGLLVTLGSALVILTGNQNWLAIPAVMGAGLIFSGLTNTCAMGSMLSVMPWNQVKPSASPSCTTEKAATSGSSANCCK